MSTEQWVFSLGSNIGDRVGYLACGVLGLRQAGVEILAVSSVYETDPWGFTDQPPFLNLTMLGRADADPLEVLQWGHDIEEEAHRQRGVRWSPRTLDIDIIAVGDRRLSGSIEVPHPRAAERGFVLVPWAEVDPDAVLDGRQVAELAHLYSSGVRRRADMTRELTSMLGLDG